MKKNKYIYGFIIGVTLTAITACSPKKEDTIITPPQDQEIETDENETDENETDKENIMEEFNHLTSGEASLKEIAAFMNENIANVTQEETSEMILKFEELHSNRREKEDERYLSEEIQKGFNELGAEGIDINLVDAIKDEEFKKLVIESRENGYKIETAEGYYYPVIDYSFYKQFSSYATPEIRDYIDIMTVESDQVFAKDAALMIAWDEVVNRTISIEKYLTQYPESKKAEYMKQLYNNYVFITLHGLNNTPLFDYSTEKIAEDAKNAYSTALTQSNDSKFLKILGEFMTLVDKNDDKRTDEVESFIEANTNIDGDESNDTLKDPSRYNAAGIDDADEFDETFELLQTALADNDRDTFADYIAYPIKVTIDGNRTEIKNKEEFLQYFDEIMNENVKNAFLNQKIEEVFVNYQGIMVGDGQIWLNQLDKTKHKFSIYAINN